MDFVAGVSHELRTPLAVICSAAENLADGVVGEKGQVAQYGTLIRDEGRRLTGMVEQTLQFAAGQSNRQTYQLRRQPVAEIVEDALRRAKPALESADYHVEKTVAEDLPAIEVDAAALSQTLRTSSETPSSTVARAVGSACGPSRPKRPPAEKKCGSR